MKSRLLQLCCCLSLVLLTAACSTNTYLSDQSAHGLLSDETLQRHSSGQALAFSRAQVISDNNVAFMSKLEMVESAQVSIDLAYYIFADDYSSSALARALVAAARRGVRVRLLVDYSSAYANLDMYSMLEAQGNGGRGSLEVRFYNRPTRNMVIDAAYLSLRCNEAGADENCSTAKMAEIMQRFDAELVNGQAAADLGISNLDIGGSGTFLSGFYSKQVDLMALAVMQGRGMPSTDSSAPQVTAEQLESLWKLAQIYWRSRTGNVFERLVAKMQLAVISLVAGDVVDPVYEIVAENLPIERRDLPESLRDWNYATDYLHQKLLLVDGKTMQLGGRNIEDTYHLLDEQLESGLRFMDTDVRIELTARGASVEQAFERIWGLQQMVATLAEVHQHAPNDLAANMHAVRAASETCARDAACFDREFRKLAKDPAGRQAERLDNLQSRADHFEQSLRRSMRSTSATTIDIDSGAQIYYLENIPFSGKYGDELQGRSVGASNGREARFGKRIHGVALAGMQNACEVATAAQPRRVIINNAYFFPPSNLVAMLAKMIDGSLDCRYVDLTIVTNSRQTTDLSVVNMLGRHVAFAFTDYLRSIRDSDRGATFSYYEMQPNAGPIHHSLHSKVWVLGDDLIVGSANADVRSYMMDANNAVIIRNAPGMLQQYIAALDATLANPDVARELSDYYLSTPREQALAEDQQMFRGIVNSIAGDGRLSEAQMNLAEQRFAELLNLIYSLTLEGLQGIDGSAEKQDRFNRIFKLI